MVLIHNLMKETKHLFMLFMGFRIQENNEIILIHQIVLCRIISQGFPCSINSSCSKENLMTYFLVFISLLPASACPQSRQVSAAGVGQPPRHLLHRKSCHPHKSRLLVVVGVRVVLMLLKPRPQHFSGLGGHVVQSYLSCDWSVFCQ